ncbi:MAG: hypothetical protein ACJKSS_00565 [Patescibacteria group bacterium UBA2103]
MLGNPNLGLDVGQANELKLALRRSEWNNKHLKQLCEGNILKQVLDVLRGDAEITPVNRVLDLSTPVIEEGHEIVRHFKQGKLVPWHKVRLSRVDPVGLQYDSKVFSLNPKTLRPNFLKGQRPANICMRDFFIENPHHMPDGRRRGERILFWGTICRSKNGLYVPGIFEGRRYNRRVSIDEFAEYEKYDEVCAVLAPAPKPF